MRFRHEPTRDGGMVYRVSGPTDRVVEPWVVVKESAALRRLGIYGQRGVYAARDFPKNFTLGRYLGYVMGLADRPATLAAMDAIYAGGGGDKFLEVEEPTTGALFVVDGDRPPQSDAAQARAFGGVVVLREKVWPAPGFCAELMNDARNTDLVNNVVFSYGGVCETLAPIPKYDPAKSLDDNCRSELLVDYGEHFFGDSQ